MRIFYQVHGKLSLILHLPARQEIRRVGLLLQHLAYVFLVAQDPVNGRSAPLCFTGNRLDAMFLQVSLNFADTITLDVQLKNLPHDSRFLWNNFEFAIFAFRVAQKLRVVEECPAALHPAAHSELHILAVRLSLSLGQCGVLVDDAVAGGQSIVSPTSK